MKIVILLSILLGFVHISSSQDKILLKKTNEHLEVKVVEIGIKNIIYKKYNFQEGPNYYFKKDNVASIIYENGNRELFIGSRTINEYKSLCIKKERQYNQQAKVGLIVATAIPLAAGLALDYNIKYYNYPKSQVKPILLLSAIPGIVLFTTSKLVSLRYSEKLKSLNIGINLSEKQKGFSVEYRF